MTADRRILATHLLDNLDAAIETLPPECRPTGMDPSETPRDRLRDAEGVTP